MFVSQYKTEANINLRRHLPSGKHTMQMAIAAKPWRNHRHSQTFPFIIILIVHVPYQIYVHDQHGQEARLLPQIMTALHHDQGQRIFPYIYLVRRQKIGHRFNHGDQN